MLFRRDVFIWLLAVVMVSCTAPAAPREISGARDVTQPLVTAPADRPSNQSELPAVENPTDAPVTDPAVVLDVGDDFQAVVDANDPGTRYVVAAGLHRLQQVVPQNGDVFVGEDGAVLSGARDISDNAVEWQSDGGQWYLEGQTQEGPARGQLKDGGRPRDLNPEDLFVDGQRYVHVEDLGLLEPGSYFFDYQRDRIWLAGNPAELGLIETSVAPYAFSGEQVRDVIIENLVIERYASPAQFGAIGGRAAYDWTLRRLTVRDNHGGGIRIGPGFTVEDSSVVDNGQIGIVGTGVDEETGYTAPVTVRRNEIARNGGLDYDLQWEGGGTKFARTLSGILVEDNWVHDNFGHGLWFDLHVYSALVRNNLVDGNQWIGIFYEISHGSHPELGGPDARIVSNEVRGNGHGASDVRRGAAIFVSNSEDVEVANNWLHDNYGGIALRQVPGREADTTDVTIRNNDIGHHTGCSGFFVEGGYSRREARDYVGTANVQFADNLYRDIPDQGFCWIDRQLGREDWAALDNVTAEEPSDDVAPSPSPAPPAMAGHLADGVYGAA